MMAMKGRIQQSTAVSTALNVKLLIIINSEMHDNKISKIKSKFVAYSFLPSIFRYPPMNTMLSVFSVPFLCNHGNLRSIHIPKNISL